MKKLLSIFAALTIFLAFTFEDDISKQIYEQFNTYASTYPQEKAYLHLDKPYYTAGETIWLKAYLIEAATNTLDSASVPLYVELIDNQLGKIIDTKILKLEQGMAQGDFELSDSLHAGYYRLRAYTNWMRNFDESLFFSKDIKVHKSGEAIAPVKYDAQEIAFQFFPEGGQIIEGMENKVAFKATDMQGNGVDVKGIIINKTGDTLLRFESEHLGMGVFTFKAEPNETYTAKVKYRQVFEKEVALPNIEKEGYIMGIESVMDDKFIRVYAGHNYTKPKDSGYMVVLGQSQGKVCYLAKTPVSNKAMFVKIPKEKFPQGISQFTVFDETGKPRCERLIFINKNDFLTINITPDKASYLPKEEVKLNIEAKDSDGDPIEGNFSVVVSDAKQVLQPTYDDNILNYLLLSSEVKGAIEKPDYYFATRSQEISRHLDILLMTQGWRRFRWEDVLKPELPQPKFMIEKGLSLSGEITRPNGKMFEKPISLTFVMFMEDKTRRIGMGEAAIDGTFSLNGLDFNGKANLMVQAVAGKGNRNTKVFINKLPAPKLQVVTIPFNPVTFDEKDLADYLRRTEENLAIERMIKARKEQLLQEVVVKAKREAAMRDGRVLYSDASNTIKITPQMQSYGNVLDLLRGRVPGVQVMGNAMDPVVIIRGIGSLSGSSEPTFLLDGMITDKSVILSVPVSDVDKIDILKGANAAIYGSRGGNGVISVLTKRGNSDYDWGKDKAPGIEIAEINGYAVPKEFYSPNYKEASLEDFQPINRPDYRSTIHWAPMIQTNAEGKASLTFFNSNAETTVNVSLEGLSVTGVPTQAKASYFIKK
ncbi:TonB-dependent receptor plug domain-containing protein [Emticicia sp. 17c]|uniref:TonB-dependent receptor plug domain-containing protein n=1 Tax=Emticicia sp. 17c TaxID=3127704 RepID=UPI00301D6241